MNLARPVLAATFLSLFAPAAFASAAQGTSVVLASSHGEEHAMDHGATAVEAGDLSISGAFSRATPPGAPVGGGYMTITNTGDTDDRLLSVSSTLSARAEIHEMVMEGDVARMRPVEGIAIPAGETVELRPGGYHVMFVDLEAPLVAGEVAQITLSFERAGDVEIPLAIADAAGGMDHGEMH
ncbi:copper chaperone PCu(A)C [Palleronia sp. LCG004]|uniref:copper chaperone PCu(A)C n=1 Tax=Palleronia sp. LCG004 TaxID=3079304 RepID=UPI0029428BCA|nr:copper chaperone PCu(A)C [Palleronia sp. LCG004]WOI55528.1 copper chaperone PCu(A)C [Palleronia sp. LCG004]